MGKVDIWYTTLISPNSVIDKYNNLADPKATAQVHNIVMDIFNNPYKVCKQGDKLGYLIQG